MREFDDARQLEGRELHLQCREQGALVQLGARLEHHDGLADLSPLGVRHRDDGSLLHLGALLDQLLDFAGVDVEATGENHVLGSTRDEDEPIFVNAGQVARVQPSAGESGSSQLIVLVVADRARR